MGAVQWVERRQAAAAAAAAASCSPTPSLALVVTGMDGMRCRPSFLGSGAAGLAAGGEAASPFLGSCAGEAGRSPSAPAIVFTPLRAAGCCVGRCPSGAVGAGDRAGTRFIKRRLARFMVPGSRADPTAIDAFGRFLVQRHGLAWGLVRRPPNSCLLSSLGIYIGSKICQ